MRRPVRSGPSLLTPGSTRRAYWGKKVATNIMFLAGPSLGRLLNLESFTVIGTPSSTVELLQQSNGLKVRLIGTGLTYDAQGHGTGGTITALQLLQSDGTTVVQTLTGI